jgi:hypothetical protein
LLVRSIGVSADGDILPRLANFTSDRQSFRRTVGRLVCNRKAESLHRPGICRFPAGKDRLCDLSFGLQRRRCAFGFRSPDDHVKHADPVGWEVRAALYQEEKTGLGKDITAQLLANDVKELVDYMLFLDEPQITGNIQTTSGFAGNVRNPARSIAKAGLFVSSP